MVNSRIHDGQVRGANFRLLPAAVCAWGVASVVVTSGRELPTWGVPLVLGAATTSCLMSAWGLAWGRPLVTAAAAALCVSLLAIAGVMWRWDGLTQQSLSVSMRRAAENGERVRVTFRHDSPLRVVAGRFEDSWVTDVDLRRIDAGGEISEGSLPTEVWWSDRESYHFLEGGGHRDYVAIAKFDPSSYGHPALRLVSQPIVVSGESSEHEPFPPWARAIREDTVNRAEKLLDRDVGALVTGMSYGDDSRMTPDTKEAFKTSGLTHLTAVSGSNVALVTLLGLRAARWARSPRTISLLLGIAAVVGYVYLVGPDSSVLRASWMGVLGCWGMILGRGGFALSWLWVTVVGLLIADPRLSHDVGLTLSVLATAGILCQGKALRDMCERFCPVVLAEAVSMSTIATVWCAPVITAISGVWGTYTIPANVVVTPLVPAVTLVGLAATLMAPFPFFADALTVCAGWSASPIVGVAHGVTALPWSVLEMGQSPWAVIGACSVSLVAAMTIFRWSTTAPTRLATTGKGEKEP